MLTYDKPLYLILLVFIPVVIYLRHFWKNRGGRLAFSIAVWKEDKIGGVGFWTRSVVFLSALFFWVGLFFLIVAISGPGLVKQERFFLSRGMDIMIVLDESPSMGARDFPPVNRFESAKEVIHRFINSRENDTIGLVTFGKEAALRTPPTLDYGNLNDRIDSLEIMELGNGTAIGMGIAVASLHLRQSTAKEQVIILLTDGDNNAGEIMPLSAAEIAKKLGIRIYTVGIASEGNVPLEFTDPETGKVFSGTYRSSLHEDLLKRIAEITGGRFFSTRSPGVLETVFRTIDSVETMEKRVKVKISRIPIHRELIYLSLILILGDFLLRKWLLREVLP